MTEEEFRKIVKSLKLSADRLGDSLEKLSVSTRRASADMITLGLHLEHTGKTGQDKQQ